MRFALMIGVVCAVSTQGVIADVTAFYNKPAWQTAVNNNYTTIDFTGYPELTFITTQYTELGVTFPEGNDNIYHNSNIFTNDGVGLHDGLDDSITLLFSSEMQYIAIDFPGITIIELYLNDA